MQRSVRVWRRDEVAVWTTLGAAFSALVLIANMFISVQLALMLSSGELALGRSHAFALTLSWLCFWIWLYAAFIAYRLRGRRMYY